RAHGPPDLPADDGAARHAGGGPGRPQRRGPDRAAARRRALGGGVMTTYRGHPGRTAAVRSLLQRALGVGETRGPVHLAVGLSGTVDHRDEVAEECQRVALQRQSLLHRRGDVPRELLTDVRENLLILAVPVLLGLVVAGVRRRAGPGHRRDRRIRPWRTPEGPQVP